MKEYRIDIDPRILELLGPSLYTNIYYVLAELIANAYDAEAKNVYVIAEEDRITVEDDGKGMSYEAGDVENFLKVGKESRTTEEQSITGDLNRRKMGRKGVGKLAALSVSKNVYVKTIRNGERSGFILTRRPSPEGVLEALPDSQIEFKFVDGDGSAIEMVNPQYRMHHTMSAVQKNILKMFPLVDGNFRIHVIRGKQHVVIDKLDEGLVRELVTLITYGDEFAHLCQLVANDFPKHRNELIKAKPSVEIPIVMRNKEGVEKEYSLEIEGWIGTYRSTRGKKLEMSDFPDNFISLFANKKMGEFNIIPVVGQNRLNEVYVVGQLHVDLFERTELPDMALSNRQGYKSDDPRYIAVTEYVRKHILAETIRIRERYTALKSEKRKMKEFEKQRAGEEALRVEVERFRDSVVEEASKKIAQLADISDESARGGVKKAIASSIDQGNLNLGLKKKADSLKKRILISQTKKDKAFADVLFQMLIFNGVDAEDILYTNCDNEVCRVPEEFGVYDYLREFFIKSYSSEMMHVLFVTSENTKQSWGAVTEVGAAWITQMDHKIFNIQPFKPEHPLDNDKVWQSTSRDPSTDELCMEKIDADVFCVKVEDVCKKLGYKPNDRVKNMEYLQTLVKVDS